MRSTIRHLLPGAALILATSAVLLLADLKNRHRPEPVQAKKYTREHPARFAILQHSSVGLMDEVQKGILEALASRGYHDGETLKTTLYIAQGEIPLMRQMAENIVSGDYDLAASISTVCLQALAKADEKRRMPMVFCAVTSPVASDIGIKQLDTLDKPGFLTGYGTAQPVEEIFREAVAANPRLKVVGVVWNPTEGNSVVCTERARAIAKELGLTLIEAPIESANDVRTAADSLVARGAEAFWTGGDATLISAYEVLQQAADKARIPIFSNISGHTQNGSLFDFGANYYQVGYQTGLLAADILDGRSPADIPVRNLMPGRLGLNERARASLRDTWTFTPGQYDRAGFVVERTGEVREIQPTRANSAVAEQGGPDTRPVVPPSGGKLPWRAQVIIYIETAPSEETFHGLQEGLKLNGLVEGRDYVLKFRSAQGELPVIGTLFDSAITEGTDIYLTMSTPALQNAVRKITRQPVVFTFVTDPMAANAGTSYEKHLPNITGVSTLAPTEEMVGMLKTYFPGWKRIGTLYCPTEVNSVINMKNFQDAAARAGLTVESVAANTIGELPDAALALASKDLDVVVQIPDNLSASGFGAIARACRTRRVPLFAFQSAMIDQGAVVALSMDYHQAGLDTAAKAARVMRGDNPANMPFSRPSKSLLVVSVPNARDAGMTLPPALLGKADKVVK